MRVICPNDKVSTILIMIGFESRGELIITCTALILQVAKCLDIVSFSTETSLTLHAMQDLDRVLISYDEVTGRSKRHACRFVQTMSYTPDVLT